MAETLVALERRDDGVALVRLQNGKVNSLSSAVLGQIESVARDLTADPPGAVVITGSERIFAAGADIAEFAGPDEAREIGGLFLRALEAVAAIPRVTIAAVAGPALGGGCELALACDLVLVSADCKIGQPEVQVGVFPPLAAAILPRRVGWQAAADLVLTGRVVKGEEARQMGLAARVFPAESFAAEAEKVVQALAGLSGPVLRATKKALRAAAAPALGALEAIEGIYLDELMGTEDAAEGLHAFLEKRAPVWKDR
jgi:cyclohexa-1,5-dienecarbonyl-CoA hydratase